MLRFSQRKGLTPIKIKIQKDSIDDDLKNSLWSAITIVYFERVSFKEYYEKTKVFVLKNVEITEVLKRGGLLTPFFKENITLFYFKDAEQLKTLINEIY